MQTLETTGPKSIDWAAGLFEGEGCIHRRTDKKHHKSPWRLSLEMTDKGTVEDFHKTLNTGTMSGPVHPPSRKDYHKSTWIWRASSRADVITVLNYFLPLLGYNRKKKAIACLKEYEPYATN